MQQQVFSITQINEYLRGKMDADTLLSQVAVRGEISNYKMSPSGHHYFTLKDESSALKCVMFKSQALRLRFRPENGMKVIAMGKITVYPRDGAFQLYCGSMAMDGIGDLYAAFEQLKAKLAAQGLFAPEHKKKLPAIPGTIGSFLQIDQQAHPVWYAFFHTFNYTSWLYVVIYLLLILAFNYFYVAIQYNPVEIANNLRRNNGSIPGFRPGKPTSDFLTRTLNKITLIGAIFLAAVAVLPIILGNLTGMSIQLGGTSLLIVVGVALDTTRSLDSFMTMRNHKGFLG